MSNVVTIDLGEGTEDVPAPSSTGTRVTSGATPITQQERPVSRTARMLPPSAPNLVHYATPATAETLSMSPVPAPIVNGTRKKSFDTMARSSAQPGLPSPAPSDENNNSPTFTENGLPALSNRSNGTLRMSMDGAGAPYPNPLSHGLMQQPAFYPQQLHPRQNPLSSQQQQFMGQPSFQRQIPASIDHQQRQLQQLQHQQQQQQQSMQQPQQLPPQAHQPRRNFTTNMQNPAYAGFNSIASGQPLRTSLSAPSYPLPPQQSPAIARPQDLPAPRASLNTLLHKLDQKQVELTSELTGTDIGRLSLLRDAVKRDDWFYQLLSQMFCLRTASPSLLPKSIKSLGSSSWEYLNLLLCANSELNAKLLEFFSEFPEPIMDVYSGPSGGRELYESRANDVGQFLVQLPQHWDGLVSQCKQWAAPPLVQDMVEILKLKSPVLQTTCFRAIARIIWGFEETLGFKALESVHTQDQRYYLKYGHHRDPTEKTQAYMKLRRLQQVWNATLEASTARGDPVSEFPIPDDVRIFFETPSQAARLRMQQLYSQSGQPQSPAYPIQAPLEHQQVNYQMLQQWYQQAQQNGWAVSSPAQPQSPYGVPTQHAQFLQKQAFMSNLPQGRGQTISPHVMQNPIGNVPGPPQRSKRRLFPAVSVVARQPMHPNPSVSGLHQAPLRSPIIGSATLKPNAPRLYRHVTGLATGPIKVKRKIPVQKLSFQISAKTFAKLARTSPPEHPGEQHVRILEEGLVMYRLRCAVLPASGIDSESSWVIADNVWPEEFAFQINDVSLGTRRKLHHGRYLPIDITAHLREGENVLKVFVDWVDDDKRKTRYALAVEAVGVMSHESILKGLTRMPCEQSLSSIKNTLTGHGTVEDDDLAVTSSSTTIKLFDPFSNSKLVDTPVRGTNCLHKDVFDLEVFLTLCKREKPSWPAVVDCWRCPLCRGDVRPQTLLVDEFLVEVIANLKNRNLLDVRAIVVEADGSWKPKEEERTGVRSPSLEREMRGSANGSIPTAASATAPPSRVVEIIELD